MNKKYYHLITANRVVLGGKITEFRHFKLISVYFLELDGSTKKIDYKLINQKMEGTALIHSWMEDIEAFQGSLVLEYNFEKQQLSISNYKKLLRKWKHSTKSNLLEKYTMEGGREMVSETEKILFNRPEFEKQFLGYSSFRMLLNPYFQLNEGKSELTLLNFFGPDLNLDLVLSSELQEENTIVNTAQINTIKFDKSALTKMVRNITHTIDLRVDPQVDMEEIFIFNIDHSPKQVDLYLDVEVVDGFYQTTLAHQLIELTENQMIDMASEWKNEEIPQEKHLTFYKK